MVPVPIICHAILIEGRARINRKRRGNARRVISLFPKPSDCSPNRPTGRPTDQTGRLMIDGTITCGCLVTACMEHLLPLTPPPRSTLITDLLDISSIAFPSPLLSPAVVLQFSVCAKCAVHSDVYLHYIAANALNDWGLGVFSAVTARRSTFGQ